MRLVEMQTSQCKCRSIERWKIALVELGYRGQVQLQCMQKDELGCSLTDAALR